MSILMSKLYKCPCGKWHKSRTTVSRHRKAIESGEMDIKKDNVQKDVPLDKGQVSQMDTKKDTNGQSTSTFLKEINLKGEFDKMGKTINPKEEDQNECGACKAKFAGEPKFCPNCGVEFE